MNGGQSVSQEKLDKLVIDLAARDAALRELRAPTQEAVTSADVAQMHYEAFHEAGLSVEHWYGTLFQEFVASGSWAANAFGMVPSQNSQSWLDTMSHALVTNVYTNESKQITVGQTTVTVYAETLLQDFWRNFVSSGLFESGANTLVMKTLLGSLVEGGLGELLTLPLKYATIENYTAIAVANQISSYIANFVSEFTFGSLVEKELGLVLANVFKRFVALIEDPNQLPSDYIITVAKTYAWTQAGKIADEITSQTPSQPSLSATMYKMAAYRYATERTVNEDYVTQPFNNELQARLGNGQLSQAQNTAIGNVLNKIYTLHDLAADVFKEGLPDSLAWKAGEYTSQQFPTLGQDFYTNLSSETHQALENYFGVVTPVLAENIARFFFWVGYYANNVTSGKVYDPVLQAEYLGVDLGYALFGGANGGLGDLNNYALSSSTAKIIWGDEGDDNVYFTLGGASAETKAFLGNGNNVFSGALNTTGVYVVTGNGNDTITGGQ